MAEWLNAAASTFWRQNVPIQHRRAMFLSTFGCDPEDCVEVWRALVLFGQVPRATNFFHLLWLLYFFKHYNTMVANGNRVGVTDRTFRDKVFRLIDALAVLAPVFVRTYLWFFCVVLRNFKNPHQQIFPPIQITWDSRFRAGGAQVREGHFAATSMDGTDFRIYRPFRGSRGWYSYKTNSSGKRYIFGIGIPSGLLCFLEGPYPAGHWHDLTIYRRTMRHLLLPGEMVIADGGYRGEPTVITPEDTIDPNALRLMSTARARHEGINGMFKHFRILRDIYRHDRSKHENIVKCIAIFVQLKLRRGEGTYEVTDFNMPNPPGPEHPLARAANEIRNVQMDLANRSVIIQLEVIDENVNDENETAPAVVTQNDEDDEN